MKFYMVVRETKSLPEGETIRTFITQEAAEQCLQKMQDKFKKNKFRIQILEYT